MKRYKSTFSFISRDKRRSCLFILCLALLSLPFSVRAGEIEYTLELDSRDLSVDEVTVENGEVYTRLHLTDGVSDGLPGSCEVPMRILRFLVPTYSNNFRIEVTDRNENEDIPLHKPLFPCQAPMPTSTSSIQFNSPNREVYGYNKTDLSPYVSTETFVDGWDHVVVVAVNPIIFKDENTLTFSHRIAVKLMYDVCSPEELCFSPVYTISAQQKETLGDFVVNPTSLDRPKSSMAKATLSYRPEYYYIIVPESLKEGVSRLAWWKRQKGYTVVVKTIESILNTPAYRKGSTDIPDEAASLRAYLKDEYSTIKDSFYCLLIGDYRTSMPIRKARASDNPTIYELENFNGSHYIPTDNYFSDLTTNYKLYSKVFKGENHYFMDYFHEYSTDIFIGRLLLSSIEDLKIYANKLILYETNPGCGSSSYLDRAMAFEHYDMHYRDEWKNIYQLMSNYNLYSDCTWLIDDGSSSLTGQQVIQNMKDVGFASWHGHGNPGAISTCKAWSKDGRGIFALSSYGRNETDLEGPGTGKGLDNLDNPLKPFIAYSISCTITPFDLYRSDDKIDDAGELSTGRYFNIPHNMGSSFTAGGYYGGVALIGNTREGYTGSEIFCGYSAKLERYFINEIIQNRKIGVAHQKSKIDYMLNDTPKNIFKDSLEVNSKILYGCNLIGDPEFEMWIKNPLKMNSLVFNPTTSYLDIKGNELNGSNIFISNGDNCISNFKSYSANSLSMNLSALPNIGINIFSIWKTGYLPKLFLLTYNTVNYPFYDTTKDYVITDGWLGTYDKVSFIIGKNSFFKIGVFNTFHCGSMLEVENGGSLTVKCDNTVDIEGSVIREGGKMTVIGQTVIIGPGFKCEKGGEFSVSNSVNTQSCFIIEN